MIYYFKSVDQGEHSMTKALTIWAFGPKFMLPDPVNAGCSLVLHLEFQPWKERRDRVPNISWLARIDHRWALVSSGDGLNEEAERNIEDGFRDQS